MVLNPDFIVVLILGLCLWLGALTIFVFMAVRRYKELTVGLNKKDLTAVTVDLKKQAKLVDQQISSLNIRYQDLLESLQPFVQKVGYLRFNPFDNTGGDHSFCLVLLDADDNGILITSLHTRQQTRLYTKEILGGKPSDKSELTKEEVDCINKANQWRKR